MTDHAAEARRLLALTDGHAASADSLAAIATTHALLAIADRLDRIAPPTAIHFDTQPAPDTLNTEPGWTAPTTGTYQLSTGQEPRPICGTPKPAQPDMICDDVPHHYGVHDHLRTWWPADHYPPGAGPCRIPTDTYDCRLYSGHPGPCDTTNDHRTS